MATNKERISNLEITENAPPTINPDGWEAYFMDPRVVRNPSALRSSAFQNFDSGEGGLGGGGSTTNAIPQLADIESVIKEEYIDPATNTTKVRAIIKIRNSSGEDLLGVDARIALSQSQGGQ